jgi:hypothetical protein
MTIRVSRVGSEKSMSEIAIDLQAWPITSGKVQPGFTVNIQTQRGTLLFLVGRGLSFDEPPHTQELFCQGTHSPFH